MASTWSALKVELLETGLNSGQWGNLTNANLGDAVLGEAITGSATVDFATDADVTITLTDFATTQAARNLRLNITESSTGVGSVRNLILGSGCQIEKFYLVRNNGTGAKTIKNTSGTGISVPAGKSTLVYNDGTNVVDGASYFTSLTLGSALPVASGGTGLTAGTSGGVLAYTASGTLASSAALTQYGVVYGGGAGAVPVATANGTTGQAFIATTSGAPSWGTLPVAGGGTGLTAGTSGGIPAYTASGTLTSSGVLAQYGVVIGGGAGAVPTSTAVGTSTHVLTSNGAGVAPTFQALPAGGVTTFTAGTTGFTPNTATSGAVTLAGTLATANGGTNLGGATPFTSTGIVYASSASVLATGSTLTFNGTDLTFQSAIKLLNSDGGGNKAILSTHLYGGSGGTGTLTLASTYGNANRSQIKVGTGGAAVISFENDSSEKARITLGLSVGTTSDPGAGAIYATGAITAFFSDKRLKTVSGKIENALDKVAKLSGVYYTFNDTAKSFGYDSDEVQVGVLAQDVEEVLPEIVKAAPFDLDENNNSKSGENYKTVQYEKLVPLLIEAINELQAKVKLLENK